MKYYFDKVFSASAILIFRIFNTCVSSSICRYLLLFTIFQILGNILDFCKTSTQDSWIETRFIICSIIWHLVFNLPLWGQMKKLMFRAGRGRRLMYTLLFYWTFAVLDLATIYILSQQKPLWNSRWLTSTTMLLSFLFVVSFICAFSETWCYLFHL